MTDIGLTWDRLGLLLFVGMLISAAVFVITNFFKSYLAEAAAHHFGKFFPVVLNTALALCLFPLTLHSVGVTAAIDYSAEYVAATLLVGVVGGMMTRLSYETLAFLRDFLPDLIKRKSGV